MLKERDLSYADLAGADLSDAHLIRAHLNGANLSKGAKVSAAKLAFADLTGAIYAPASESPNPYVAGIKGLERVNAPSGDVGGLVQLRKLLKEAGLSDSAREATSSIQRSITDDQLPSDSPRFAPTEGCLRTVGFDWTTAYG